MSDNTSIFVFRNNGLFGEKNTNHIAHPVFIKKLVIQVSYVTSILPLTSFLCYHGKAINIIFSVPFLRKNPPLNRQTFSE